MGLSIYVCDLHMYVYNREGGGAINSDRHREKDKKKHNTYTLTTLIYNRR